MKHARQRAFVGLGSNLQDPVRQVRAGIAALDDLPGTAVVGTSRLYRSDPVGPPGQPDYVNAAACIETTLDAVTLLRHLQEIELRQGRDRRQHWGPRTLDLDVLLFGEAILRTPALSVPHPHLHERAFVLIPLLDLDPDLMIPGLGRADVLLAGIHTDGVDFLKETGDGG